MARRPRITQHNQLAPDRYWLNLTDDQLLEIAFETDDPSALENIRFEVPETDERPKLELAYKTLGKAAYVRCVHCRYNNHNRGFVMQYADGSRLLVGKDCGKAIWGADFKLIEKDFDTAKERAFFLRRRQSVLRNSSQVLNGLARLQTHPSLKQFRDTKRSFNENMSGLAGALAELSVRGGTLVIDQRVRDLDAEAHRDEIQEIAAQRTGRKPKGSPKPIFKIVPTAIGVLQGQGFWRIDDQPDTKINALAARASGSIQQLQNKMTVVEFRKSFLGLGGLIEHLRDEVSRLDALTEAFELGNLTLIARWANARDIGRERFAASIGAITMTLDERDVRTVSWPTNYQPPSLAWLEQFEEATRA